MLGWAWQANPGYPLLGKTHSRLYYFSSFSSSTFPSSISVSSSSHSSLRLAASFALLRPLVFCDAITFIMNGGLWLSSSDRLFLGPIFTDLAITFYCRRLDAAHCLSQLLGVVSVSVLSPEATTTFQCSSTVPTTPRKIPDRRELLSSSELARNH
ncbi:hypothetical protein M9H77_17744 [Catharanthus roseus]|uniref:Uncharacterized protein n=1 Tax=Catharanthus roseus TaxID=4058 RepID=A0ACC0B5G4_CATRO|nr:hypothetical protein M9H77_17744 [Catharanthus roseus]